MENPNNIDILIALDNMQEVSFSYNPDFDYSTLSLRNLSFGMKYETKASKDTEKVGITVTAIYNAGNESLSEYSLLMEFKVRGLAQLISTDSKGEEIINRDFILNLLNISIGTLRGAFFLRTKGTGLEKFPIPLIPTSVLEKEIKIISK